MFNDHYYFLPLLLALTFFACDTNPLVAVSESDTLTKHEVALHVSDTTLQSKKAIATCEQIECKIWARVNLTEQFMYLYRNGSRVNTFQVTTGNSTHKTPTMNRRPSGPMFVKYTSKKFPGGNYMGLGNMPYVVFIKGGYAIHGTTKGNIKLLGKKVSHGCIRLHPDNAKILYEMIVELGLENVWVTIEN